MSPLILMALLWQAPKAASPPQAFPQISAQANQAREANQLDQAVRLYGQALQLNPRWTEGWWWLGTLHYDKDQYPQCRDAFRHFVGLDPKSPPGHAMLGLCEFQTKDFGAALTHLERAWSLGLPIEQQLTLVSLYHIVLLQTRTGNFERALQISRLLVRKDPNQAKIIAAAGIAALRRPIFPQELPVDDRDLAMKLGAAALGLGDRPIEESYRLFEELIASYPNTPNIHYSFALILLANEPDRGVAELKSELQLNPDHLPANASLAFEYLKRGDPQSALPYAERAAKIAPGNFAARNAYGRALVELGNLGPGIKELETAVKLAPDSPQVHYSLGQAYAKAGRKEDAARERSEFARLKKLERTPENPEQK